MYCIHCGRKLREQTRFCPSCGTLVRFTKENIRFHPMKKTVLQKLAILRNIQIVAIVLFGILEYGLFLITIITGQLGYSGVSHRFLIDWFLKFLLYTALVSREFKSMRMLKTYPIGLKQKYQWELFIAAIGTLLYIEDSGAILLGMIYVFLKIGMLAVIGQDLAAFVWLEDEYYSSIKNNKQKMNDDKVWRAGDLRNKLAMMEMNWFLIKIIIFGISIGIYYVRGNNPERETATYLMLIIYGAANLIAQVGVLRTIKKNPYGLFNKYYLEPMNAVIIAYFLYQTMAFPPIILLFYIIFKFYNWNIVCRNRDALKCLETLHYFQTKATTKKQQLRC